MLIDEKITVIEKQSGFSLIELMIAMIIGLIVIGAVTNIYMITIKSSSDTVKSAKLNNDLDLVMSLMVNDIRRAGYWAGAVPGAEPKENPFTQMPVANQGQTNVHLPVPAGDCILYTYDYDGDTGDIPNDPDQYTANDLDEYVGFKLENNEIKIRTSINDVAAYAACVGVACCGSAYGNWESITDSNVVTINSLVITDESQCENVTTDVACSIADLPGETLAYVRAYSIEIDAELANDATVIKSQIGTVKVRNDRIFLAP